MKRGPNMQDVADAAKVSLMTVSYALRNHPSISLATRERIQKIAKELGYERSPLVSALMTHIRGKEETNGQPVIAYLSAYRDKETMLSNWFRRICFEGASRRAEALGFRLELFLVPPQPRGTTARLSKKLATLNVRGVICGVSDRDTPPVELDWSAFASCVIGNSHAYPRHHHIESNYPEMARLAIDRLKTLGYTRLGFLSGSFESARVEDAVISTMVGYNLSLPSREQIHCCIVPKKHWDANHVTSWVKRHKLDALIIQTHTTYDFLSLSVRIPEELAIATLERTEGSFLAGINQGPDEIGAAAVDLIVSELYQNHYGIPHVRQSILLDGYWEDGASAPPKDAAARAGAQLYG